MPLTYKGVYNPVCPVCSAQITPDASPIVVHHNNTFYHGVLWCRSCFSRIEQLCNHSGTEKTSEQTEVKLHEVLERHAMDIPSDAEAKGFWLCSFNFGRPGLVINYE